MGLVVATPTEVRSSNEHHGELIAGARFSHPDSAHHFQQSERIADTLRQALDVRLPGGIALDGKTYDTTRLEVLPDKIRVFQTLASEPNSCLIVYTPTDEILVVRGDVADAENEIKSILSNSSNIEFLKIVSEKLQEIADIRSNNPLNRFNRKEFGNESEVLSTLMVEAKSLLDLTNQLIISDNRVDKSPYDLNNYPTPAVVQEYMDRLVKLDKSYSEFLNTLSEKLEFYVEALTDLSVSISSEDSFESQQTTANEHKALLAKICSRYIVRKALDTDQSVTAPEISSAELLVEHFRQQLVLNSDLATEQNNRDSNFVLNSINLRLYATDPETVCAGLVEILKNQSSYSSFHAMSPFELSEFADRTLVEFVGIPRDFVDFYRQFSEVSKLHEGSPERLEAQSRLEDLAKKVVSIKPSQERVLDWTSKLEEVERQITSPGQASKISDLFIDYHIASLNEGLVSGNSRATDIQNYFKRIGANSAFIESLNNPQTHLPEVSKLKDFLEESKALVKKKFEGIDERTAHDFVKAIYSRRPDILLYHQDHFLKHSLALVLDKIKDQMTAGKIKIEDPATIAKKIKAGNCDAILNNIERILLFGLEDFGK